jgi:hypothetical protein
MSLLQEKLSIVVCSKSDYSGLLSTLKSLNSLEADLPQIILVLSGYSETDLERIKSKFASLKIDLVHISPQGIYSAQNLGLRKVKNRLVLFLNGGDALANPFGLDLLITQIGENPWGYGEIDLVEINSIHSKRYKFSYIELCHRLGLKYVPHPATVIDAQQAIRYGGFDENYTSAADHKLLLMFSRESSPIVVKTLISTFYRGGVSSRNQVDIVKDCKNISRELFGYFFRNRFLDSLIWSAVLIIRKILKG